MEGDGRDVYIEKHEKRFADRNARLESGWGETTWTTRDNFFKVRRLNGRRLGNEWEAGGISATKDTKGTEER